LKHMQPNEFWIDWKTFCVAFNRLEIVYLDGDTCQSEQRFRQTVLSAPHTRTFQGCWKRGSTAGGCRNNLDTFHINPQLLVNIAEPDELLIALSQHHAQDPRVIGFSVYKVAANSRPISYCHRRSFDRRKPCAIPRTVILDRLWRVFIWKVAHT